MGELVLIRHGQTEWSRDRRHTGWTDVPLTEAGERQAGELRPLLRGRDVGRVVTSPLTRAVRTAELAGLRGGETDPDLREWDYGGYEGVTTVDIRRERPGWDLWSDGVVPGGTGHPGETVEEVGERADRLLAPLAPLVGDAGAPDVVLVAHGHVLRVVTARWLGLDPRNGALFALGTGTVSTLGREHDRPVVTSWNLSP
ncbi:histidine phosphatase family protein [Nocardiopsis sp. CT-R113]|uniref:Histidine phosphatase family protein n=1 Tax=Nocardiopsis codii TaxID=3065942 RepID=A0ABU7KBA1_9ACTN|nr:histidine phosphatase family protein [Nocardiopsis sp. CT-R113]MEE2038847.1 histidine phosphatase family protein [Nocardiopsis sp. CT-R113]